MAENRARSLIEKYSINTTPIQEEKSPVMLGEIITSKPTSRSQSLIDKYSQTTITNTTSQNPTFKDNFVKPKRFDIEKINWGYWKFRRFKRWVEEYEKLYVGVLRSSWMGK